MNKPNDEDVVVDGVTITVSYVNILERMGLDVDDAHDEELETEQEQYLNSLVKGPKSEKTKKTKFRSHKF